MPSSLSVSTRLPLRQASLGDVQVRHDLDATDHSCLVGLGRTRHVVQHAVDAVADAQTLGRRLEVQVAGSCLERIEDQHVHQLDDRRLSSQRPDVVECAFLVIGDDLYHGAAQVHCVGHRLLRGRHDRRVDLGRRCRHQLHRALVRPAEFVDRRRIELAAGGNDQGPAVVQLQRQDGVLLQILAR
jgi:hypothetical protein